MEIMITQFREELKKYKEKVKKPDLLSDLKLNLDRLDQDYRDCQNKLEGLSFPDGPQGGGKGKKSKSSNKAALPTKQDLIQEMQSVFVDPLTRYGHFFLQSKGKVKASLSFQNFFCSEPLQYYRCVFNSRSSLV